MKIILSAILLSILSMSANASVQLHFTNGWTLDLDLDLDIDVNSRDPYFLNEYKDVAEFTLKTDLDPQPLYFQNLATGEYVPDRFINGNYINLSGNHIYASSRVGLANNGTVYTRYISNYTFSSDTSKSWLEVLTDATPHSFVTLLGKNFLTGELIKGTTSLDYITHSSPVPVPGAVWLFGTGLAGLLAHKRRKAQLI